MNRYSFYGFGPGHAIPESMQIDDGSDSEAADRDEAATIVHNSSLDLETYISSYQGMAKLQRLLYISERCPNLQIEALKMATTAVMRTYNTGLYQVIHKKLLEALTKGSVLPDAVAGFVRNTPPLDTNWIEGTSKRAAQKLEKLDTDLKNYRGNSIKESIRRGHDDLGDHHLECGDLHNALKCYSRARDYCTNARQLVNTCMNVIKVSIYLQNWGHVLNYTKKAEALMENELKNAPSSQPSPLLDFAAGLVDLDLKRYKDAAKHFLRCQFDSCDFPEIASTNNIAVYGALCSLATFTRAELQKSVIANSSFKLFLELEPQVREMLQAFYNSKYGVCLKILEELKDHLLLDIYLSRHIAYLYSRIRKRALCQYFSPYVSADMAKMATAFNTTVADLENELMLLILEGEINARIDSHNKVIYAKDINSRQHTFEKAIGLGEEYRRSAAFLVLRSAVIKNKVVVQADKGKCEMGP
ncbi:COP9 signalosome complex subunit 1-like [Watersipora subatra]|uniref:COP9 signalosome complex subunit 1-like n=1 Tax=Watersipora subatra TaxID=2589382 RepID=UPI00355B24C4